MVVAGYDSDAVLADPLTSRAKIELLCAVIKLYQNIKVCVLQPCLYMLNNKLSPLMKEFIREAGATYYLVPPGLHRSLISES